MTMMRAAVTAQINTLGENEVEVIISTSALARDGHILEPSGCDLSNYQVNPIVLWQHNPDVPVGRAADLKINGDKIQARVTFAPTGISPKADEVRGLVKNGIVSGVSVGFDVIDAEPLDSKQPRGGQRFTKWELLEVSFCSVPADPGAAVTARAQTKEKTPMSNTQTRTGKKLSAATKKQIDNANDHLDNALERHKALGDHMDNLREMSEGDESTRADLSDYHEDAADVHRALGRSLKACQRCMRAALKNTKPPVNDEEDEEDDTDPNAGDGNSSGDGNDDEVRSANFRRRKAELRALTRKH